MVVAGPRNRGWKLDEQTGELRANHAGVEAFRLSGNGIDFVSTPLVPDSARADKVMTIGTRATEKDVTMTTGNSQHLEPVQINLNFIGALPGSTSTVNVMYMQLTHDTTDMTSVLRLKGTDWTFTINKDLQDAYVFQGEIDFGSGTNTIGGEAACLGMTMNAGAGTLTGSRYVAVFVTSGSAGTSSALFLSHRGGTLTNSLHIEVNDSQTITNAIYINESGTITNFLKFETTGGAIAASVNAMTTNNTSHALRIIIDSTVAYIPAFPNANWS